MPTDTNPFSESWHRYDRRYQGHMGEFFYHVEEQDFDKILNSLPQDAKVLDLGAGTGRLVSRCGSKFRLFIGLDISLPALQIANNKKKNFPEVFLINGDAARLPFRDATFAAVVAIGTFCYIQFPETFFQEIKRILRPKGFFIFSFFNKNPWLNFWPLSRLNPKACRFSLIEIHNMLENQGIAVLSDRSIFHIPRSLFWGLYYCVPGYRLKKIYVDTALKIELFLQNITFLKQKGFQLNIIGQSLSA